MKKVKAALCVVGLIFLFATAPPLIVWWWDHYIRVICPRMPASTRPAFAKSSGSPGQFEVTLTCEPKTDCPYAIVITPTGTVFSPWTPALGRSSATSFAFSGLLTGVYRVLLVGGAPTAKGQVEVRALNAKNSFAFAPGHLPTIAATQVTMAPSGLCCFGGDGLSSLTRF